MANVLTLSTDYSVSGGQQQHVQSTNGLADRSVSEL